MSIEKSIKPTGRYCFKKKLSGMVLYVEMELEVKNSVDEFALSCIPQQPGNTFLSSTSYKIYWRKATEEDLVNLRIVNKR